MDTQQIKIDNIIQKWQVLTKIPTFEASHVAAAATWTVDLGMNILLLNDYIEL